MACARKAWALIFAATLFAAVVGMPQQTHGSRVSRQTVSTFAADRGQFFQDIFQIPIQALQAVAMLITNRQNRVQRRREELAAAALLEEKEQRGTLRNA